jgi:hypothetical protein
MVTAVMIWFFSSRDGDNQSMWSSPSIIPSTSSRATLSTTALPSMFECLYKINQFDFFTLVTCYMAFKRSSPTYPTGANPKSFVLDDLNGDTILDLAVTSYDDNSITILLGYGNGTFHTPFIYSTGTGTNPLGITAGHFNNDTYIDLGK